MFFLRLSSGIVSGQYPLEESGGPLSQMSEAVNNIDRPKTSDEMHAGNMNLKVTEGNLQHLWLVEAI